MKKLICVISVICGSYYSFAQTAEEFIAQGDEFLGQLIPNYRAALGKYVFAIRQNEGNAALNFKIGVCYLSAIDKTKSIPYLEKAFELEPNISPEIRFLLGRAYQFNYEFVKAKKSYIKYKGTLTEKEYKKKKISRTIVNLIWDERKIVEDEYAIVRGLENIIKRRSSECRVGLKLIANPDPNFIIKNIGAPINSPDPDYAPVISADEEVMYFTSRRSGSTGGKTDEIDGMFYEDIYMSVNIDGLWQSPIQLGATINSDVHESAIGLSADGQTMFLYIIDVDSAYLYGGDIYISRLKGDEWTKPKRMPEGINSSAYEYSATLSADERLLIFVSNRDGGVGGRDIYMSRKMPNGSWGKPENLSRINTRYDEDGVFFHADGKTLYFSSKGQKGMGGYDVFKSTMSKKGRWSRPVNLSFPINTPDDDIYFVLTASGERGYYTSAREGGIGEKDIYIINFPKDSVQALTLLTGHISDEKTKEFLEAKIVLEDLDKNEVIGEFFSNAKTGKYLVALPFGTNYGLSVTKEGYLFHSENFNIPYAKIFTKIKKDVELKKLEVGAKIVLKNIFFGFNKDSLRAESEAELDRLYQFMVDNAKMRVEISGHTDNKGSAEYNRTLSDKRAKSVVNYLVEHGINEDRLVAKGYGMDRPIAPNQNEDESDNPEGRQLNRRTEFEIIGN